MGLPATVRAIKFNLCNPASNFRPHYCGVAVIGTGAFFGVLR
jgi:hypothetical protein